MNILLFDTKERSRLFPLTQTRAVADLRCGILTLQEWWQKLLKQQVYLLTEPYLQPLYEQVPPGDLLLIDASVIPSDQLVEQLKQLNEGEGIADKTGFIAGRSSYIDELSFGQSFQDQLAITQVEPCLRLHSPADLAVLNKSFIEQQFPLITKGRMSVPVPDSVQVTRSVNIFIEEGAQLDYCILNATAGPIYIGKNSVVMEGSVIRGPLALCEGAVVKMGSKIYGATTLGPFSVGGGEIKNSVLMGYSNKAHDGYLGDSVVGEWCNLGAGTSNSNVKNNASLVKLWDYYSASYIDATLKCGVIMGDYSRTAINTSINTGTVVGVCCNVVSEKMPPKLVPDFTWDVLTGEKYDLDKAGRDIKNWMRMKNTDFNHEKQDVLKHIFDNAIN